MASRRNVVSLYIAPARSGKSYRMTVRIYSDFDVCSVDEFCRRFYENYKVTRARKIGKYGQEDLNTALYMNGYKHTGFSIGTDIKLRVYDKRYE